MKQFFAIWNCRRQALKMQATLVVVLLLVCACALHAYPAEEESIQKRVTCDVIGELTILGNSAGGSVCAVHCLARGYRGGHCNAQKVCVCRKDTWYG